MTGAEMRAWRKRNDYASQSMLQRELKLGSRATVSAWEASEEVPRIVELALHALERDPALRSEGGKRASLQERRAMRRREKTDA